MLMLVIMNKMCFANNKLWHHNKNHNICILRNPHQCWGISSKYWVKVTPPKVNLFHHSWGMCSSALNIGILLKTGSRSPKKVGTGKRWISNLFPWISLVPGGFLSTSVEDFLWIKTYPLFITHQLHLQQQPILQRPHLLFDVGWKWFYISKVESRRFRWK